jgi:hypothetical protein
MALDWNRVFGILRTEADAAVFDVAQCWVVSFAEAWLPIRPQASL